MNNPLLRIMLNTLVGYETIMTLIVLFESKPSGSETVMPSIE
jgi:hypothetical protein